MSVRSPVLIYTSTVRQCMPFGFHGRSLHCSSGSSRLTIAVPQRFGARSTPLSQAMAEFAQRLECVREKKKDQHNCAAKD